MLIALDSNILIYAEGINDERRRLLATLLLDAIGPGNLVLPLQAAGEVFRALLRSAIHTPKSAALRVRAWQSHFRSQETTIKVFDRALQIASLHGLQVWDSIILSAAEESGAGYLLSEDMQDGFIWQSVTIINPFAGDTEKIIERLMKATLH
jgi:predicted nucleic acid-binding protein